MCVSLPAHPTTPASLSTPAARRPSLIAETALLLPQGLEEQQPASTRRKSFDAGMLTPKAAAAASAAPVEGEEAPRPARDRNSSSEPHAYDGDSYF